MYYATYDVAILVIYAIYPLQCFEKILMHVSFENYWRRDNYFLNNCIIRVFYRFKKRRRYNTYLLIMWQI